MRNPRGAVISLLLGVAFAVTGVLLGIWAALRQFRIQWAYDWALWVATNSGIPLTLRPGQVANLAIEPHWGMLAAFSAFVLCALAFGSLRSARLSMRPAGESSDGKARLVLKGGPLRVGRPVEGSLLLAREPEPGELFDVRLWCTRDRTGDTPRERAYVEEQRTKATRGAHGWSVPFRFEVPVTAPPTGNPGPLQAPRYVFQWELTLTRAKAWFAFSTGFDLVLDPAPAEELRAEEARVAPEVRSAAEALAPMMGQAKLLPHQREQLKALSPDELAMVRKHAATSWRTAIWVIIGFFAFFLGLPFLFFVGMFILAALRQP